jgi:uncharacterized protein YuzE
MLSQKDKMSIEYNSMYDILYVRIKESSDTYGDEKIPGIVLNYDYETDEIVGFDIWDFKLRMRNKEHIILPAQIELEEIYSKILAGTL